MVEGPQINLVKQEKERKEHKTEIRAKESEIKEKTKAIGRLNEKIAQLSAIIETQQRELGYQLEQIQELEQSAITQKKELEDAISVAHTFETIVNRQKKELKEALDAVDASKKQEYDQKVMIDLLQGT